MKTSATVRKKSRTPAAEAKSAPPPGKNRTKRKIIQEQAQRARPAIQAVALLLERFPAPDQEPICLGLYAPDAQEVFVAGSFNGWQPSATPLQKQDDGRWVVELVLAPGRYEYRFFVDGRWTDDPLSPAFVSNPFGGLNCVLLAGGQPPPDPAAVGATDRVSMRTL